MVTGTVLEREGYCTEVARDGEDVGAAVRLQPGRDSADRTYGVVGGGRPRVLRSEPVVEREDGAAALYYGFPTPVAGPACGRMVFTDVHVASGTGDSGKEVFPSCSVELSPQQLALAFLIFDLSSCVQPTESAPPPRPVIY